MAKLPLQVLDRAVLRAQSVAEELAERYGGHLREDLQSHLVERAWKAWETYDPDVNGGNGQAWKNWLTDQLRYGIRDVLREHKGDRKKWKKQFLATHTVESLDVLTEGGDDREEVDPELAWGDCSATIIRQILTLEVLAHFRPRERYIVEQHYFAGREKRDIAQDLGISPTRLRQIERQAFLRVKEDLLAQPRGPELVRLILGEDP